MDIALWVDQPLETEGANQGCPSLTPFLLEGAGAYPGVIVVPGGGYVRRAPHEGEVIAHWLNTLGISALVLNYRVFPFTYPVQFEEAKRAVRLVRYHAEAWRIDPQRIGLIGFSAGGHVSATLGTRFDYGNAEAADPVERQSCRPDLMVLGYPVITMGAFAHQGSKEALLGDHKDDPALVALLSNEKHVRADTPPTFLWHTVDDAGVPVENSLLFAESLRQHQVPFALHLFQSGSHGLGLAAGHPEAQVWPALCENWLRRQQFI